MSFWNNQENNAIKVMIIMLFVAGAGYFVYNGVHENSLDNTGQVGQAKKTQRKNPDGTSDVDMSKCVDGTPSVALTAAPIGTSPITIVSTAASNAVHVPWITVRLTNPGDCPVDVSNMSFLLTTNEVTSWPPVQYLQLVHLLSTGTASSSGVQLDGKKEVPGGVLPDDGIIPVPVGSVTGTGSGSSTLTFNFNFPGTAAVRIAPHSFEVFRLYGNSQNVPANLFGYTGIAGSGNEVFFKLQLISLTGTSILGGTPLTQTVATGTLPTTLTTPVIKIHY